MKIYEGINIKWWMVAASNQCGDHQKTKEKKHIKLEGKIKLETKYYLLIFGAFLNRFCDMFCHPLKHS